MVIKSSFDPKIKWVLPEGAVPYKPNEVPEGTEHTLLIKEQKDCGILLRVQIIKHLPRMRKETMFIQMLEGLHENEFQSFNSCKRQRVT